MLIIYLSIKMMKLQTLLLSIIPVVCLCQILSKLDELDPNTGSKRDLGVKFCRFWTVDQSVAILDFAINEKLFRRLVSRVK